MLTFARIRPLWLFLLTLALLPGVPMAEAYAQEEPAAEEALTYDLTPRFEPGQRSRFSFWTQRDQAITMQARDERRTTTVRYVFEGEITWEVNSVANDGSATCVMTIDWITATLIPAQGERQVNDSRQASGDTGPLHGLLKAMAGVPITVEVDSNGSIDGVSGIEAVSQRAPEGVTVPDELDYIESASDLATIPHAPESARIGDAWSAQFTWSHELGAMSYQTRYRLESVEEVAGIPVATVTATSDLNLEPDRSKLPEGAPPATVRLHRGQASSQIIFDLDRHEAVGRNTIQTTEIETSFSLPNQTVTQIVEERLQSQVMRIAEE